MKRNWNKFVDHISQVMSVNQNELPEQHIKALITTKNAFGPSFEVERQKVEELNALISKFSNGSQAELVEQWKELYKKF